MNNAMEVQRNTNLRRSTKFIPNFEVSIFSINYFITKNNCQINNYLENNYLGINFLGKNHKEVIIKIFFSDI